MCPFTGLSLRFQAAAADCPLGYLYLVPVEQDRGDLRRRPAGQLQPQRRCLGKQLRMGAHHARVRAGRGLERLQPALAPRPHPAVDRPRE